MGVVLNKTDREAPTPSDRAPRFPNPEVRQGSPVQWGISVKRIRLGLPSSVGKFPH